MVLRPIFRLWPSCCQGFKATEFLQDEDDSTTNKPHTGGPGFFSFSGSYTIAGIAVKLKEWFR
jgi:hypothetical protein